MKNAARFLTLLFLSFPILSEPAMAAECDKPWLFFDLGENTLIYTEGRFPANDPNGDLVDMHYLEGVPEYLDGLASKGYHISLIVNIPAEWGVRGLIRYIERPANALTGDPGGWTSGAQPFNWRLFERIFVPLSDENRKPQHSDLPFAPGELWLYRQAMKTVPSGCQAFLQTGIKEEVHAAEAVGMYATLHSKTRRRSALMPETEIAAFLATKADEVSETMRRQAEAEAQAREEGREILRRTDPGATE